MNSAYIRAAAGAACIGVGLALMLSAAGQVKRPCEDCEDDAVATIENVAEASADLTTDD